VGNVYRRLRACGDGSKAEEAGVTTRQTFAAGDTIRLAHLEAVARMNAENIDLRDRVTELEAEKAAAVEAERSRIVAWLRALYGDHRGCPVAMEALSIADQIERGEHWPDA